MAQLLSSKQLLDLRAQPIKQRYVHIIYVHMHTYVHMYVSIMLCTYGYTCKNSSTSLISTALCHYLGTKHLVKIIVPQGL